ncbi:MAG: hypothetical protein SGI91_22940 [Alphaproteobacteria bacterium]|nr:hypothetical protein [Alphaproteobacteria bacterium]
MASTDTPTAAKKPRQGRSPAYPFISVQKALEKAEQLRVAEGGRPKHFSPRPAIAKAWEMGEKTGPTKQTIAALGYFGLFEFEGSGEDRSARLTDTALKILLDKQPVSPERDALVQKVALTPTIHKELWEKWGADLPSDPTLETFLVRDRGFSEDGAKDLMEAYKETIKFAKLGQSAAIPAKEDPPRPEIQVGDWVQATVNGADVFDRPRRVRRIFNHEGKMWVQVEGTESGIPMEQTTLQKKQAAPDPTVPIRNIYDDAKSSIMRKEVFALDEGDVTLTFPDDLSPDSYNDLEGYLKLFLSKAKRRAQKERAEKFGKIERGIEGDEN